MGLSAVLVEGFRAEECYPLPRKPGVVKQVVYFLAEFSDQRIRIQPEEIAAAYLVPYEEALSLLPFPEAKRVLADAQQFLSKDIMAVISVI